MFGSIKRFFNDSKTLVLNTLVFKTRTANPLYTQVLIILAFALMVILSSYFMGNIVRTELVNNAEAALNSVQTNIASDLQELETMLGSIAETVRIMILRGEDYDTITVFLTDLARYMLVNERLMERFVGIYGVFDVFDGKFYATNGWIPPEDYVLEDRPWYKVALRANGGIGVTDPYLDQSMDGLAIMYARRLFDEEGRPLGVVALNVELDRVREYALHTYFTGNSCGVLLSRDLEILAHPENLYQGKNLREIDIGISDFAEELEQGKRITERAVKNHRNETSVAFFRQIENGWYIGVVTPENVFYKETWEMRRILIILGLVLAALLSAILLRVIAQKQKSDERIQDMYREADDSKKTVSMLKNILNGLDAMIYVTVPKTGEILFLNDVMKDHFHLEDDCVGQPCYKILQRGMDDICDFCPCHQLNNDPESTVMWIENSNLTKCVYRNTDRYIEWPGVGQAHLQHSVDITELNAAKEEAIQANRSKSNFLARVSHEIRTPMNAIVGITEIQLQNKTLSSDVQEALGKIYDSGYLLLNIINDILDLSKIEAGKLELVPVKYDVANLLNDTVHLNIMRLDSKPIEFMLQLDDKIPAALYGDDLRIKQILNNLLSNAFKYTDSGKVTLSVAAEHAHEDEAIMVTLVFHVSDTGQGMSQEQVSQLFNDYTRFNMEANRTTEGTGLGMSITRQLVRLMNGEILVTSELGKGSMFTVRLPQITVGSDVLSRDVTENLMQFHRGRAMQRDKMPQIVRDYMPYGRVLIVDDVETNLYVAKGLMAPYGLSIQTASSGIEAIEKIKNGAAFDVIYMDHFMPKLDGVETVKIIREMGYKKPIVALTANALAGQDAIFLANGFDGFISKPIDIRQLNVSLNTLIRDTYPSEVVEAARRQKESLKDSSADTPVLPSTDHQLAVVFVRDAERAFAVLETAYKNKCRRDDDIQAFIINIHAMKSALASIGETELSAFALKLEMAGRNRDIDAMNQGAPVFLQQLREVIEKNRPAEIEDNSTISDLSDEERVFLREKLLAVQNACAAYNKKTAKEALATLTEKTWPHPVRELLDAITVHLLHSEFEEAANAADGFLSD